MTDNQQPVADSHEVVEVRGARVNNLPDISLDIPQRRLTVFTGVSGSGEPPHRDLDRLQLQHAPGHVSAVRGPRPGVGDRCLPTRGRGAHHQAVMAHADWLIDFGPAPGRTGGRVVFTGTPADLVARAETLTATHLGSYLQRVAA